MSELISVGVHLHETFQKRAGPMLYSRGRNYTMFFVQDTQQLTRGNEEVGERM